MGRLRHRLCGRTGERGETIVESLASILLVAIVFVFLLTSLVTAARLNARNEADDAAFLMSARSGAAGKMRVEVVVNDSAPIDVEVKPYQTPLKDGNDAYYDYEYPAS